jgi:hypothetical protein
MSEPFHTFFILLGSADLWLYIIAAHLIWRVLYAIFHVYFLRAGDYVLE